MSFVDSLLADKSYVLKYWKFLLSIVIIGITWWRARRTQKREQQEANAASAKSPQLDGAEYIGEYEADDQVDLLKSHLDNCEHVPFAGASKTLDGGANEFYKIANDRRSVRKYDSKRPVDFKIIQKCIHAAGTSPSGAHTEPWTFCVIENAKVKRDIREIIEAEEYLNYKQRMARQWTADLGPLKTDYVKEYLTDAPYLVLVFKQTYGTRTNGKKQQNYYHEVSTAIATGILLTAFQCAGLNSLVTTPLNCGPALRTLLQRPDNEKLMVLLPVGYAAPDCCVPDLHRKPIEDILVRY